MKKLAVLILLCSAFILSSLANSKFIRADKMTQIIKQPYKCYDFSSGTPQLSSEDYLGFIPHNGVEYHCYGIWFSQVDYIVSNIGTVYSWSPSVFYVDPITGEVSVYITSSNGNFPYTGLIYNY